MIEDQNRQTMPSNNGSYVTPGMPPLENNGKVISFFEFWPTWLIYLPVAIQWLILSIIHRSITLPLLANPKLPLSGMVGVPKSLLLSQATGECHKAILPWFVHTVSEQNPYDQATSIMEIMKAQDFKFPTVCKPDIGCRGSGVKLVKDQTELESYIKSYPIGTSIMVQCLAKYEPEAGVFYVKKPGEAEGKIISLALKYSPYVVGNGKDTLLELLEKDERTLKLLHLYSDRHKDHLDDVLPAGQPYKLVFSASHCRGAVFKDANHIITPALTKRLNEILNDLPEFYYGRLDIKFSSVDQLQTGKDIEIIEINTASSESLHIWDSNTRLITAISTLLMQYRTLFKLGALNKKRGFKAPSLSAFIKAWRKEQNLKPFYPETD